jgi:hypothetical protein
MDLLDPQTLHRLVSVQTFAIRRILFPQEQLAEKTQQILASLNYPIDVSAESSLLAFTHTEINEQAYADQLIQQFTKT